MTNQHAPLTKYEIFSQGFILRLKSGLAGAGLAALCVPRLFVNYQAGFIIGTVLFSFVCIAGGIRDLNDPLVGEIRRFQKISIKRVLAETIGILVFITCLYTLMK